MGEGSGGAHNIYCTVTVLATFRMICLPQARPLMGPKTPDWEVAPGWALRLRCVGSSLICHMIGQQHPGGLFQVPCYSSYMVTESGRTARLRWFYVCQAKSLHAPRLPSGGQVALVCGRHSLGLRPPCPSIVHICGGSGAFGRRVFKINFYFFIAYLGRD